MAKKFEVETKFTAKDGIQGPLGQMALKVNTVAAKWERTFANVNKRIGKIGKTVGDGTRRAAQVGVAATGTLVAALAKATHVGAGFEQTLTSAGQRFGGIEQGTTAFDELAKSALAVSSTTEFAGKEAAGALQFMAVAGEDASVAMGTLRTFADLATSGETELSRAADIASDSLGPLGLKIEKTGVAAVDAANKIQAYERTADLMSSTVGAGNLNMENLFESVTAGAGAFRGAGQETEGFLAGVATLSNAGIKGSKAGLDLARVMQRLTATTGEASFAIKKLKLKKFISDPKTGEIKDLPDILEAIKKKTDGLKEVKRTQLLNKLFGAESKAAADVLLNNIDDLRKKQRLFTDEATGSNARLAKGMRNTTLGAFKTLGSTIETIQIEVFQVMREDIIKATKAATQWAKENKGLITEKTKAAFKFVSENFSDIVETGKDLARVVAVFWGLNAALTVTQGILGVIATLTGAVAGSLLIIGGVVAALIVALALLVFYWDEVKAAYDSLFETMTSSESGWKRLGATILLLSNPITILTTSADRLKKQWGPVRDFFAELWSDIKTMFVDSLEAITQKIEGAFKLLSKLGLVNDAIATGDETVGKSFRVLGSDLAENEQITTLGERKFDSDEPAAFERMAVAANVAPSLSPDLFGQQRNRIGETFQQRSALDLAPAVLPAKPEVVDTSATEIVRSLTETKERVQVDVNLNDRSGAVESVKSNKTSDSLTVTHSAGGL
jgi:TP901 family phage tail tape measure protein